MNGVTRRFRDRVWIEREVIGIVNQYIPTDSPLAGLTDFAISRWKRAIGPALVSHRRIVELVEEIARRTRLHVDTSKGVFDESGESSISSVELLIQQLHREATAVAAELR